MVIPEIQVRKLLCFPLPCAPPIVVSHDREEKKRRKEENAIRAGQYQAEPGKLKTMNFHGRQSTEYLLEKGTDKFIDPTEKPRVLGGI